MVNQYTMRFYFSKKTSLAIVGDAEAEDVVGMLGVVTQGTDDTDYLLGSEFGIGLPEACHTATHDGR